MSKLILDVLKEKENRELKIHSALFAQIIIGEERQRKDFNEIKLKNLKDSISTSGQLQPGICYSNEEGKPVLIAGERRLRSCKELEIPFQYILKEETDPWSLEVMELAENLDREALTWQEEVDAKERIHKLYQEKNGVPRIGSRGGHTLKDSAKMFNESTGLISQDIELSFFAKEFPEVAKASSKTEAKKIVKRFKKQADRSIALKQIKKEQPLDRNVEQATLLRFDSSCLHSDLLSSELEPNSFDLIFFDPPWGVDFHKNKLGNESQGTYEDSRKSFKKNFPLWLDKLGIAAKPDCFLYLFYGMPMYHFVYTHLKRRGWVVNPIPIIWHKKGMHRTRNPEISHGRSYEPILFARRGTKKLQFGGLTDMIETPQPGATLKQNHPSAKHPDIYLELLQRSAAPGDRILDPMAGSGMLGVAAEELFVSRRLSYLLIEKDIHFKNLCVFNLAKGYDSLVNGKEKKFDNKDFKQLNPGTPEWMDFWRKNEDKQGEMLTWMKERNTKVI